MNGRALATFVRSFIASDACPPTRKTDSQKRHRDHDHDGRVLAVNARRGFRTFALRRALSRTGINPESRPTANERAWKRAYTLRISLRRTRAQKRKVINEPRLNPITRRGGIFWLMAMHEAPFAGAALRVHHRRFPRYPFSPLTFNAFPERDRRAPRCQSQALAPQILQNTDINRLITRMALGVDIYNAGVDGGQVEEQSTRDTAKGKGKEKEGGSAGNLAIRQAAPTTLPSAHSRASRCIASVASLGRPNVSDDVADIANCKNYHHGTSPAPYFLTSANPCASRPVLNSMLSRVI